MDLAIITGCWGLVGSQAVSYFAEKGFQIIGLDNDMRSYFFGPEASTRNMARELSEQIEHYKPYELDIRDRTAVERLFQEYNSDVKVIIHCAAQPSHDWAAKECYTDFGVNAYGTLVLLESTRRWCPDSVFIFCSTNKVYGDRPNYLPFKELETRWEVDPDHRFAPGIDETMSIDETTHSLFGASKLAADILVQEYGRYFGMKTACFRAGCITGKNHSGSFLHGFLAFLAKCCREGQTYTILGYKGKQVRDNIHSWDLVNAFHQYYLSPRPGQVYNIGGGRFSNCSILEAIKLCEKISGKKINRSYTDTNRIGDHIWYISDYRKFQNHNPDWTPKHQIEDMLIEMLT